LDDIRVLRKRVELSASRGLGDEQPKKANETDREVKQLIERYNDLLKEY
jgi:hypothetical protein